jgi:circadian clock protein KaiC
VFLRFIEMNGEMREVIGVLKKRLGDYEKRLRKFAITDHGILIGAPLTGLRGILSRSPEFVDESHLKTLG